MPGTIAAILGGITGLAVSLLFGGMIARMEPPDPSLTIQPETLCRPARYGLLGLGVACTALGIAGFFLPVMPGTVFLLIAVWAFSRSSERLHLWLFNHPRYGRTIRDWHLYRVIPLRAKLLAIAMMSSSVAYAAIMASHNVWVPMIVGAVLVPIALWIASRPSRIAAGHAHRSSRAVAS